MLASLPLFVFPFCMLVAAVSDARKFIIPNTVSLVLIAGFFIAFAFSGLGWEVLAIHLGMGVIVLLIGVALFAFNLAGAGDGKLLACAALWLGWPDFGIAAIYIAILGGVLSLGIVILWVVARRFPGLSMRLPVLASLAAKPVRGLPAPYGVAIAAGAVLAFPGSEIFKAVVGGI